MAQPESPTIALADLAVVIEFVLSGMAIIGAVVLGAVAESPRSALLVFAGAEASLTLLAIALAYPLGLVADSLVLHFVRGGTEASVRQRVVCKYLKDIRARNSSLRSLYAKGAPESSEPLSAETASRIVSAIHPAVSRKDPYDRNEIAFQRRLYRMARLALVPGAAWTGLGVYGLLLTWTIDRDAFLGPLLFGRHWLALVVLLAALFFVVGAWISTKMRINLMADHACRAFVFHTPADVPTPSSTTTGAA